MSLVRRSEIVVLTFCYDLTPIRHQEDKIMIRYNTSDKITDKRVHDISKMTIDQSAPHLQHEAAY